MSGFDLIPSSYRRGRSLRRAFFGLGIAYVVAIGGLTSARVALTASIDVESSEIDRLQADKNVIFQRQAYIDQLERERGQLTERVKALHTLRGGPPVKDVFRAVDSTVDGRVWFLDWNFMRAGEFVELAPDSVNTGYFLIIPEASSTKVSRAWRMRTHMELKAQATDHSALAAFVSRLARQEVIETIKVLDSRRRDAEDGAVIDFELAVVVAGGRRPS